MQMIHAFNLIVIGQRVFMAVKWILFKASAASSEINYTLILPSGEWVQ